MKLCWMFALLLALTVGVRGNPLDIQYYGLGELANMEDFISKLSGVEDKIEPPEIKTTDGELSDFMIINKNGELLPYTVVADGLKLDHSDGIPSSHQTRSLYDYVPEFGKNLFAAARKKLPVSNCTKGDWSYTCCVVFPGPPPSESCFQMEVDEHRLELRGGLIVNKEKIGGWIWEGGKMCAGIPLTVLNACIFLYYLKWDGDKKEVDVCVMISWMSIVNIDYGCFHFDKKDGFSTIKLEPGDSAALVRITFVDGKPELEFWKPKSFKDTLSGVVSMVTGQSIKLGDWHKPYF